jgi:hypothetical protein
MELRSYGALKISLHLKELNLNKGETEELKIWQAYKL